MGRRGGRRAQSNQQSDAAGSDCDTSTVVVSTALLAQLNWPLSLSAPAYVTIADAA